MQIAGNLKYTLKPYGPRQAHVNWLPGFLLDVADIRCILRGIIWNLYLSLNRASRNIYLGTVTIIRAAADAATAIKSARRCNN
ncbi:hypothetical protein PUN28_006059 [Cardiocondyla obscurior]|uniref:Uncharacterized protein n=1 Tax=Cardiocondyla obscurior TaxID=286306 RepID=A0AAW2GD15_9HYME